MNGNKLYHLPEVTMVTFLQISSLRDKCIIMNKIIWTILMLLISHLTMAQFNETIRTARPGQAVGPFTTGKNVFQIQSGIAVGGYDHEFVNGLGDNLEHTTSLRFGILENFEIRSAFRIRQDKISVSEIEDRFGGLSFWNVGVRYNVLVGEGYSPSFGLQTDVKLTWVDQAYQSKRIGPRIMLIHGQKLSETFRLTSNWSVSWNGNNNTPKAAYVINVSFPIAPNLGCFVESYGDIVNNDFDVRWDIGLGYLVNNDFQLDLSTGFGRNDGFNDWFIDGGVSWRMKFDK